MPLWPSFAQVMESALRSVRLSACSVRMSGRRAPFLIPIPTPERAIAARPRASTLPCFARSLSTAAGSMARSKAWPPSIWRFRAVARPKEMTSLCLVSRSKAGASSFTASFTPLEARTLISAAETEVVASMATIAASALKFILSPSNFEQVAPDDDFAFVVLAHALGPHVVGDRGIILRGQMREHEGLHARCGRQPAQILGHDVAGEQVLAQRRRVGHALEQILKAGQMDDFRHEHVGALGERDQLGRIGGVARDHDRAVGSIEAVGVGMDDRGMAHAR